MSCEEIAGPSTQWPRHLFKVAVTVPAVMVSAVCAGAVFGDGQHLLHQAPHPAEVRPQGLYQGQDCGTSSSKGRFPCPTRAYGLAAESHILTCPGFGVMVSSPCWSLGNSRQWAIPGKQWRSSAWPLPVVRSVQRQYCRQCHIVCTCVLSLHAQALSSNVVLKDLDLRQHFKVEPSLARRIHEQVEADTRLLQSVRVMDYSMLLGVHQGSSGSGSGSKGGAPTQGISAVQQPQQQQQQVNFAEHSNAAGMQGFTP